MIPGGQGEHQQKAPHYNNRRKSQKNFLRYRQIPHHIKTAAFLHPDPLSLSGSGRNLVSHDIFWWKQYVSACFRLRGTRFLCFDYQAEGIKMV